MSNNQIRNEVFQKDSILSLWTYFYHIIGGKLWALSMITIYPYIEYSKKEFGLFFHVVIARYMVITPYSACSDLRDNKFLRCSDRNVNGIYIYMNMIINNIVTKKIIPSLLKLFRKFNVLIYCYVFVMHFFFFFFFFFIGPHLYFLLLSFLSEISIMSI